MPEEVAPLRARLDGDRLAGHPVAVAVTGDGARNARAGADALLARGGFASLLVLGVSGALTPDLRTADLIVAARVRDEEGRAHDAPGAQVGAVAQATGADLRAGGVEGA